MDNVNIESTSNYNERFEKKIIEEMESITFEYDGLSGQGEKLLQILNYSPKVVKPTKETINNLKVIEMPQLSEIEKLDYSELDMLPKKRSDKETIKQMIKNLIISIIDNIIKNISINKSEKNNIEEIDNITNEKNIIKNENIVPKINLTENVIRELKIYLFNQDDFIIINITPDDSISMIKERIINKIIAEKDYELQFTSEKDYDLRSIEIIDDQFIMGLAAIKDVKSIYDNDIKIIAFVENKIFKIKSSKL